MRGPGKKREDKQVAAELVSLSKVPVTAEVHCHAYARLGVTGETFGRLDGQFATLHDESGRHVLTVHMLMMIHDAQKAVAVLADPPETFGLRNEIMVSFDDTEKGRTVAEAMTIEAGDLTKRRA